MTDAHDPNATPPHLPPPAPPAGLPTTPPTAPPAGPPTASFTPASPPGPPGVPPPGIPPTTAATAGGSGGSGRGLKIGLGVLGGVLLLGGGAFAATRLGGNSGPGSPDAAVEDLIGSLADEDALGALGALDPTERDAVIDEVETLADDLERLGILGDDFSLGDLPGVEVEVDDLEFDVEEVDGREDLVRVYVTDGSAEGTFDPDEFAYGDLVEELVDRFDANLGDSVEGEFDIDDLPEEPFLVARDTGDDGWRVSVGYTIAEMAREEAGNPDLDDAVEPAGADSPEEAVERVVEVLGGDGTLEDLIALLSPTEMAPLLEYAPTLVDPDVLASSADQEGPLPYEVTDLDLDVDERGDRATVTVESIEVVVDIDGRPTEFTYADGCIELDPDLVTGAIDDALEQSAGGFGLAFDLDLSAIDDGDICFGEFDDIIASGIDAIFEVFGAPFSIPPPPDFDDIEVPSLQIVVTEHDGEWFVAPISSGARSIGTSLEGVEREFVDDVLGWVEELGDLFGGF